MKKKHWMVLYTI